MAAEATPSVVTIEVAGAQQSGTGSGVIIRSDGYIVTNNHVVAAAGDGGTITVDLSDGRRAAATLVGTDPSSDLAVVKVDIDGLPAVTFADSDSVVVGELVVAIGSPLGLDGTVTSGVVSAVDRPVSTGDSADGQTVIDAIQTDAAINPGNSGGALLDADGDVVGINSAIATLGSSASQLPGQSAESGSIGVGFAIPSNTVKSVAEQIITSGRATHAQLGVQARDYATAAAAGAQVQEVTIGGPAAEAGLRRGDIVTEVDGRRIENVDTLIVSVREHTPGATVTITYLRDGAERTTTATLVVAPTG
ncbi:MAG: trypsin-like peptidase domain-containing protein [Geodermatophilaceae bacterium]|nr:trypsin-like peptidase domain-containing protein [Geodermatophilaceae bacterium]